MRIENVKVVNESKSLKLPAYATENSAGFDFMACFDCSEPIKIFDFASQKVVPYDDNAMKEGFRLHPGKRVIIPTGLRFELPEDLECQVRPRSGLAAKNGITVLNAPGTIDADYRGVVGVILYNAGDYPIIINHGDRIAQGVIAPYVRVNFVESDLSETERGEGGFGHSGK